MTLAPTHALPSPGAIMARLDGLDADLAALRPEFEQAAQDFYRTKREWEKYLASAFVASEGRNQEERRSRALLSLVKDPAYKDLVVAEARYEGAKAALRVLETRVGIGQSLLRALSREAA